MTFSQELKQWRKLRGDMRQKNACEVLGVPIQTYKTWEQGVYEPSDLAKSGARWHMAAYNEGVSVEIYQLRYLSVIKQVAAEIINKKKS